MDKKDILDKIFADDDLGILNEKPRVHNSTEQERILESFYEIENFVNTYGREPKQNPKNIKEFQLAVRLKAFRENPEILHSSNVQDSLNLLPLASVKQTLDDIFADDTFTDLLSDEDNIFNIKHVKPFEKRAESDFIAKRKPCKDFEKYEPRFKDVQKELKKGTLKLTPFIREQNTRKIATSYEDSRLKEGTFYVQNGILFLLDTITITQKEQSYKSGTRVRTDGRTRCIFENGTESNMRYRTIPKFLGNNGYIVVENTKKEVQVRFSFDEPMEADTKRDDIKSGYIYILKSLSTDPYIATTKNLYKIGFCTTTAEERVKNAENDPTFLLAPVEIVEEYQCMNINTQKLEKFLHDFFAIACMDIQITNHGKNYSPREWFALPLSVICTAINIIIKDLMEGTEKIKGCYYDKNEEKLARYNN